MMALLQLILMGVLTQRISSLQLCDPYSQPYPCTACQSNAQLFNGYCRCQVGYYLNTVDQSYQFCGICHTSCLTCSGSLSTDCITCSSRFQYVPSTSSCTAPDNSSDQTIVQAYSFAGFGKLPDWTVSGFSSNTFQCGAITLLGGLVSGTPAISLSLNTLPSHFQIRVKVNYYFLNANGTAKSPQITIDGSSATVAGDQTSEEHKKCPGGSQPDYVYRYVDVSIDHSGDTATIEFESTASVNYGIRDVYIIVKRCASNCSSCDGYEPTKCITCSDSLRLATLAINGTCLCKGIYYQEPYAGTCVDPCPSVPTKYYGDSSTRMCVTSCPSGTYAYDDNFRCENVCPETSTRSSLPLFHDRTNSKCVVNCPQTEPYGNSDSDPALRACYAICPGSKKSVSVSNSRCVSTCPNSNLDSGVYDTFALDVSANEKTCTAFCPDGQWGDPQDATCKSVCGSTFPNMDNSTGINLCVTTCPAPNRFSDPNHYCVDICPPPLFGDITRQCQATCGSPLWGVQSVNRKCAANCPLNTWAEPTNRKCVQTTQQCNPLFANSYSRLCVAAIDCQYGTYADPTTYSCVTYCPNGYYGNKDTHKCETSCVSPYYADDGNNLCVPECMSENTYASTVPTRSCVTECNQTGSTTPWADDSTWTCVSDCDETNADYVADNTTWKCVYQCPDPLLADRSISAPACVTVCPDTYYGDYTQGTGVCVQKCSDSPAQFGDAHNGINLCVDVCTEDTYGDQTNNRLCSTTCPTPYYSQNDHLRRCVKVCNESSFGYQETCPTDPLSCPYSYNRVCYENPHSCPVNWFGDEFTNLCVDQCPTIHATFGDPLSKLCVSQCPDNPNSVANEPQTFYADPSIRQCVLQCNGSHSTPLFGNNDTRTCQPQCLDYQSYAQAQSSFRLCVDRCLDTPDFHYANNMSKVCGPSIDCPDNYYGENSTQMCVEFCPNTTTNWAFKNSTDKVCRSICPDPWVGDNSNGKYQCVQQCPSNPDRYADLDAADRVCVDTCDPGEFGDPTTRQCVPLCPEHYYSYEPTRRCLSQCPQDYFGDDEPTVRKCHATASDCTNGFGDSYLRKCTTLCTGPTPVDTFGMGKECVSVCPNDTFADSYTGTRLCVSLCPPGTLDSVAAPNLYGDPDTHKCVEKCITPYTWADPQTRLCEPLCSETPNPSYSQNFGMTCVLALNCSTAPTMTFGDNQTRSCVSFCSNDEFGDPNTRNCETQCPKDTAGTATENYYGDSSTGQRICVAICPKTPRLFGDNATNLCVQQCPGSSTWGDQTGKRSCVPGCPEDTNNAIYYAQNHQRICVRVCKNETWGLQSTRQCVEAPVDCGAQWANNQTHMCVTTCPETLGLFADHGTHVCVAVCPDGTFADDLSRECVTKCPENGVYDTFGNNQTHVCDEVCQEDGTYADPQTQNRYCVTQCSQAPEQSFADPSSKQCVPQCPAYPSLFAETDNYKCVSECVDPYFADTHSRRCLSDCDSTTEYKLLQPRVCVTLCPSDPELFGDPNSHFCQQTCTNGWYRYAVLRICVQSCATQGLLQYDGSCVKLCPDGFYANSDGNCLSSCASGFGQNTTTTCVSTCLTGFAHDGLCIAVCPDLTYGENHVCVATCSAGTASNVNNLCVSDCLDGTFAEGGTCVSDCTSDYADPNTNLCSSSCTMSKYADPTTHKCVGLCSVGFYKDPSYTCKDDCSPLYSDNITMQCTATCSNGSWGHNNQCIDECPDLFWGYETDRICYNIANQPDSSLFADDTTKTWVSVCPYSPLRFGDRTLKSCVQSCSVATQYADPISRECETACTDNQYYLDVTTKSCVLVCPVGYHANPQSGKCQQHCGNSRFDYTPERTCVTNCPKPYYGYVNTTSNQRFCMTECPDNTYAEDDLCKSGCTLPRYADPTTHRCTTHCIDSFAQDSSVTCVSDCSLSSTFADNSTNRCVQLCPEDPDYYEQDGECVMNCQTGTFADPTTNVRACRSVCTNGLFGDPVSGRCLTHCLPGYYAYDGNNLCLQTCPSNFADNSTGTCSPTCPSPTFADSLTNKCSRICSGSQYGSGRVCVGVCPEGQWGNPLTRECETTCPDFDYTFRQNNTNLCVSNCSNYPNQYADRNTNTCTDNCSLPEQFMLDVWAICTSVCPQGQYRDNSTKRCKFTCTDGYAENATRLCVTTCSQRTFANTNSKKCVDKCLTDTENLYADPTINQCVAYNLCSETAALFSDPLSGNCVDFCPQGYYAENDTRTCATSCIDGFADNLTRKCVQDCPSSENTFADSSTHKCVKVCPDDTFADNSSQTCVQPSNCPTDSWADILSKHCVPRCPSQPLYFGLDSTGRCVPQCPSTPKRYGDYQSQKCIQTCLQVNGELMFGDPDTRTCVFVCPIRSNLYGDTITKQCESTCSNNYLRDNSTQRCVATCPSDPEYYAEVGLGKCVRHCSDGLFASVDSGRVCITDCTVHQLFGDRTTNRCTANCPQPLFADNSTYLCVATCPNTVTHPYYADPRSRTCVLECPWDPSDNWRTYAEDVNRTCTTKCPQNSFAQNNTRKCVPQCPPDEYADPILRVCLADCTIRPLYYKETNSRTCVKQCPTNPKAHKYQPDHICVEMSGIVSGCPDLYYANPLNDYCTIKCPFGYFADDDTKFCKQQCDGTKYADPFDRKCKSNCTQTPNSYAHTGMPNQCIEFCPSPTFSENNTWTCTSNCPTMASGDITYAYNVTRQCVLKCPDPYYSYLPDLKCVLECPDTYYAQDETRSCDSGCMGNYSADSSTHSCVLMCPQTPEYYSHNNVCVDSCPNDSYKDISTRRCVSECPLQPLLFADDSTNQCVQTCPSSPNYFADHTTRTCQSSCPSGFFVDVPTRTCVRNCPDQQNTYADPSTFACQSACPSPYYASNLTKQCVTSCPSTPELTYALDNGRMCVRTCPQHLFGNNITLKCSAGCSDMTDAWADQTTHLCVTVCPPNWYAYNGTSQCLRTCPDPLYADSTTRSCVVDCPGTQRLFADPSTFTCVSQCPTGLFGNTQNWKCISSCQNVTSGFRLEVSNLCVEQCPQPYYAEVSTRNCVKNCGNGLYGNRVTRQCSQCPNQCVTCFDIDQCLSCQIDLYLEYGRCIEGCTLNNDVANYANEFTMKCVSANRCPTGTYGNNLTKQCTETCPAQTYGDPVTKKCESCPSTCLGCTSSNHCSTCINNAQFSASDSLCYLHCNSTHRYSLEGVCVSTCPDGTYVDYTNVNCEACNQNCLTCVGSSLNCQSCDGSFRFENRCLAQCPAGYYGTSNYSCLTCQQGVQSCNDPLTFTTETTVQNYQQVIIIKFNQPTVLDEDPSKFLDVELLLTRRVLDSSISDLVNNGVQYTAQVLPDGTIKLYLKMGVSLNNVQYKVIVTDASKIKTSTGSILQSLQNSILIERGQIYPQDELESAPLVIAGKVLSIIILIITFINLLFGVFPVYLALEAFQITSLFAYCEKLPPNLFYFLKQLRITRFVFMPNIFAGVYIQPQTTNDQIPQKVVDTQGQLSFAINGMGFFLFIMLYLLISLIVYFLTSKYVHNRPLKNIFTAVYQTRIKFGIINDFIYLFAINILVQWMMQYRYTVNSGDVGLASFFGILMFGTMCFIFGVGIRTYQREQQQFNDNFYMFIEGTNDRVRDRFFVFVYYLRKILFAIFLVATMFSPMAQAALLLSVFSLMTFMVLIIRPYKEHLRNFLHLLSQGFIGFLSGGVIYFLKMIEDEQPSGAKITCGEVLTIVIIVHLCIVTIYALYRTFQFFKYLYEQLLLTEFYTLYMDEEFDQSLQKEISELGDDRNGEIQSIQLAIDEDKHQGDLDPENETIKLRIKRRKKKDNIKNESRMEESKTMLQPTGSNKKGQYVKMDVNESRYYQMKSGSKIPEQSEYSQMNLHQSRVPNQRSSRSRDTAEWVPMKVSDQIEKLPKSDIIEEQREMYNRRKSTNYPQQSIQNPIINNEPENENDIIQISQSDQQPNNQIPHHPQDYVQSPKHKPRKSWVQDFDESGSQAHRNQSKVEQNKQNQLDLDEIPDIPCNEQIINNQQQQLEEEDGYSALEIGDILPIEDKQSPKQEVESSKQEGKKWDLEIQDLADEQKQPNAEQQSKKKKKMHLMLFEDDDFD